MRHRQGQGTHEPSSLRAGTVFLGPTLSIRADWYWFRVWGFPCIPYNHGEALCLFSGLGRAALRRKRRQRKCFREISAWR